MKYALTAEGSVLFQDLCCVGNGKKYFRKSLDIDYEFPECLNRDGKIYWNYDNDIEYNRKLLGDRTLNKAVEHFINKLALAVSLLEETAEGIRKERKWESGSKPVIFAVFRKYAEAYMLNMPFLYTFWNTEKLLLGQLELDFKAVFGKEAWEEVLKLVLIPAHETYFSKELKSFGKILTKVHENKKIRPIFNQTNPETVARELSSYEDVKRMLDRHIEKFAFISFATHVGEPMTLGVLVERIKAEQEIDIKKKLKDKKERSAEDRKQIRKIMYKLKTFTEIHERAELAQTLMFWRNQRLDVMWRGDYLVKPLFNKMAAIMGLTYKELVYLRYEEINSWFIGNAKLPVNSEIHKRMKSYAHYFKDGKITLFIDKRKYPKVEEDKKQKRQVKKPGVVKGNVVYKGKAMGKVRLIFKLKDIDKINKGEILVTTMTRPEMIVGLEKAAAFVTDEGGILSHAAIVSREMKKPCVVGTGNATKIFKNGDLVEVDAEDGYVIKLNG